MIFLDNYAVGSYQSTIEMTQFCGDFNTNSIWIFFRGVKQQHLMIFANNFQVIAVLKKNFKNDDCKALNLFFESSLKSQDYNQSIYVVFRCPVYAVNYICAGSFNLSPAVALAKSFSWDPLSFSELRMKGCVWPHETRLERIHSFDESALWRTTVHRYSIYVGVTAGTSLCEKCDEMKADFSCSLPRIRESIKNSNQQCWPTCR